MAEIRIPREGDPDATLPGGAVAGAGMNRSPETDPEHLLPEHASPGTPGAIAASDDPDLVREEIERTRARMSSTIDSIEEALLRKRAQIEEKLDVTAPVRERVQEKPLLYAGGVFGAGLLLGFLTGGKDDDREEIEELRALVRRGAVPTLEVGLGSAPDAAPTQAGEEWKQRAREWENRARLLRKERNRLERENQALRASLRGPEEEGRGLLGTVGSGLSGAVAGVVSRLTGGGRGEMEVEVDLEQSRTATTGSYGPPSSAYGTTGSARPAARGEMEVEVDLEEAHGTPHPEYHRPPGTERFYERDRGEMRVEVELEEEEESGRKPLLMGIVGSALTAVVATAVARMVTGRRHHEEELDVQVELEERRPAMPERTVHRVPETPPTYRAPAAEMEVEVELERRPEAAPGTYTAGAPDAYPAAPTGTGYAGGTTEAARTAETGHFTSPGQGEIVERGVVDPRDRLPGT